MPARHASDTDPRLAALVAELVPLGSQQETWPDGTVLDISSYLTDRVPPLDLVSGARAILRRGDAVLAFDEPAGTHVLPGGRMEPGESPLDALARELREECGCGATGEPRYVGFLRLHHVTAWREGYRYPYPDFLHLIYVVDTADEPVDGGDPFVLRPRFVPLAEVDALGLSAAERELLRAL